MTADSTRLGLFMQHHSKLTSLTKIIKEQIISKATLALFDVRLREFTSQTKPERLSKLVSMDRICTAGNRLEEITSYQARLTGPGRVTTKTPILKLPLSPYEITMERPSKLERISQICTAKTCSKCAKYVMAATTIVFKHCSIILNTPQCCPTQHILLNGF